MIYWTRRKWVRRNLTGQQG